MQTQQHQDQRAGREPQAASTHTNGRAHTNPQYYQPDVDIYESDKELILVADLPGTSQEKVSVQYENGRLTLEAAVDERPQPGMVSREYGVASFYRSFEIFEAVDLDGASAVYAEGVLTLRLPKLRAKQAKRIEVQ